MEAHLCAGFRDCASHSRAFMRGPPSRSARSKSMGLSCTLCVLLRGPCRAVARFSAKFLRTAMMSARAAVSAASAVATSWQDIHSTRASSPAKPAVATCDDDPALGSLGGHTHDVICRCGMGGPPKHRAHMAYILLMAAECCWEHQTAVCTAATVCGRYCTSGRVSG